MPQRLKTTIELDELVSSISDKLTSNHKEATRLYNYQITLLETFKHEYHKFARLGYCDLELAYLSYRLVENLFDKAQRYTKSSHQEFRSLISNQIRSDSTKFDILVKELKRVINNSATAPAIDDPLLSRFNALKHKEKDPQDSNIVIDHLKFREPIQPHELKSLVSDQTLKVLLIDYRLPKDFNHNHINHEDIVNIDPSHIEAIYKEIGPTCTGIDLENRLRQHIPQDQFARFKSRSTYDLIVVYNLNYGTIEESRFDSFTKMLIREGSGNPFIKLMDLLMFKNGDSTSMLKQHPCFLAGGVQDWFKKFGKAGLRRTATPKEESHGTISQEKDHREIPNSVTKIPHKKGPYLRNFSEYLSVANSTSNTPRSNIFAPQATELQLNGKNTILKSPIQSLSGNKNEISYNQQESAPSYSQKRDYATKETTNGKTTNTKTESSFDGNKAEYCTTGLVNLGNSCYMNCVLQCLSSTPQLTEFFSPNNNSSGSPTYRQHININNSLGTKGIVTTCFVQLLQSLFKNNGSIYSPSTFKKVVGSLSPGGQFATFDQQDCVEFLEFLLDSLHEDLNQMVVTNPDERKAIVELTPEQEQARETLPIRLASTVEWERYLKLNFSVIVDYFQGQYLSQLKCLECGTTSTTFNAFSILSLPIPKRLDNKGDDVSLDYCLKEFTTTELLDDDNKWHCSRCKRFTKSTKTISITRLPQVLIINFKRFSISSKGYFNKLDTFVKYPVDEVLDLTKYWPDVGTYVNRNGENEISTEQEQRFLSSLAKRNQSPPFRYQLYGVVNHYGNLTTGHYTSYVKKPSDSKKTRGWCYFDDSKVTYNCSTSSVLNKNAYCLFYQRI